MWSYYGAKTNIIDYYPPYQFGGEHYIFSNKKIDFEHLATWSTERRGHVIVCENTKATWMDFKPFVTQNVLSGKNCEAIWSNYAIAQDCMQLSMNNQLYKAS